MLISMFSQLCFFVRKESGRMVKSDFDHSWKLAAMTL